MRLRRGALQVLLLGGVLGATACADQIVDAEPRTSPATAVPRGPARAFAPTISSALVANVDVTIPSTNTVNIGTQPWTLVHTFARSGFYEVITTGNVHYEPNPAAASTGCGMYCVGVDASPAGTGDTGAAGLPGGELRMALEVTDGGAPYYSAGQYLETTPDGQLTTVFAVGRRINLYAARHGIAGVRSCGGLCPGYGPGPTGKYLLTTDQKVEVREVIPLQVEPDRQSVRSRETVTFTTQRHRYVGDHLYWFWHPDGGSQVQIPCSAATCSYTPEKSGRMYVVGYMEIGSQNFEVSVYSVPIQVTRAELVLTCTPARVPLGVETTCQASSTSPAITPTVVGWGYTGTATPTAPGGGVIWKFKPGQVGKFTVTVVAFVGSDVLSKTAEVEVICNFLNRATNDPILDHPAVQDKLRELWAATDFPGPNPLEKGLFITQSGGEYHFIPYAGPSTRCTSEGGNVQIPPGETLVAFVHTHPATPNTPMPTDGSCHGNTDPNAKFSDGPSPSADVPSARRLRNLFQRKIAGYIIDPDHVHRFGSDLPTDEFARNNNCVQGAS